MSVRSARLDEIAKFHELWEEFIDEHNPIAGVPVDNTRAMDQGGKLFQTYIGGSRDGSCHFWVDKDDEPQGFFLSGEPLGYFDMFEYLEKCWIVYGVYIRKPYREGSAGLELSIQAARLDMARGVVSGLTVVKASNDRGQSLIKRVGSDLVDLRYSFDLKDVAEKEIPNG